MSFPAPLTDEPMNRSSRRLFDLSALIRRLHREAAAQPPEAFVDWALDAVKVYVPFQSGLWGSGHIDAQGGAVAHAYSPHRQPAQLMADYAAIAARDPVLADMLRSPGVTINADARTPADASVRQFVDRYGIAYALSTLDVDPLNGLLNAIALWRTGSEAPFREDERLFVQAVFPHLIDAWTRNRRRQFFRKERGSVSVRWSAAACDRAGILHYAEDGFSPLLLQEWPDWRGAQLPAAIRSAVASGRQSQSVGREVVCRVTPGRDLVLLELRTVAPIDLLSPREREVALHTARGLSHKEIAVLLDLSPATVRNHLAAVSRRLDTRNKAQIATVVRAYE